MAEHRYGLYLESWRMRLSRREVPAFGAFCKMSVNTLGIEAVDDWAMLSLPRCATTTSACCSNAVSRAHFV
jgi:hypothetical protein